MCTMSDNTARKEEPIEGARYGRWTVIEFPAIGKRRSFAKCRCDCGAEKIVGVKYLRRGSSKSCGCLRQEIREKHGESWRNRSKLYPVWLSMKQRCSNPNDQNYHNYGGRGITVCPKWEKDYISFRDWARGSGYQEGLQIDRSDNDGPYSPENCRWTTSRVNCNNMRTNRLEILWGETKSLADWARDERCAVTYARLRSRLHRGWSFEKALTTPPTR